MKKIIILSLGILIGYSTYSQDVIEWQNTIGGSSDEWLRSIQQTSDMGYILGGTSNSNISGDKTEDSKGGRDFWIVKTDSIGNIQWQKTIGGSDDDELESLQQTTDGGYILGGFSKSNISGDKSENSNGLDDFWILKVDGQGNIQWQNTIGGSGLDWLSSIRQTSDGGYILGGRSSSPISGDKTENSNGLADYWIVKTDTIGNIQWQKTIGGSSNDLLYSIQQTGDGGYMLGGMSASNISGDKTENSNGLMDYWIVKIDSLGNIQWQKTIGGSNDDWLRSLHQTGDGGYILGGYSNSNISGDKTENTNGGNDYWIIKTDSAGNLQWQNTIGGSGGDILYDLKPTSDGGYILGGSSQSNVSGDKTENNLGGQDYWIVKTDSVGNVLWDNTIGGNYNDWLISFWQTYDGGYMLGGYSSSKISGDKTENNKGGGDYWIVKLTKDFNTITGRAYMDFNNNSVYDTSDLSLKNHMIYDSNSGRFTFSLADGSYNLSVLDSGNFIINSSLIQNFSSQPLLHNIVFLAINQSDSLNDFVFQASTLINDLQVTINPVSAFRPGFAARYYIHYKNVGTTSISSDVIFKPDNILTYVSSPTTPTSITADSVVWNIPTLNPFDEGNILVTVNVSIAAVLGSTVNSSAKIEPFAGDANPADNASSWGIIVTGSYDPNDILVNRETVTTTELISPPYLDYLIRFQNTGTDTAFTVKIRNPLPVNAQLNSFEFLESSHPVQLNYSNAEQLMWFQFDNILLPDSNTNELLSHGYIRYRIKPQSTLSVGDLIENSASIFFDFNAPIYTNTAVTEIVLPSSIPGIKNNFDFSIYPNPATNEVNISFTLKEEKEIKIELFNSLGQIVKTISKQKYTTGKNQINFSTENLSKGIYHTKFSVGDEVVTRKIFII